MPTLVYQSELVTLWHGHAEDVLPILDTESVDLVVTDPPYGVNQQSNHRAELFDLMANDGPADRAVVHQVLRECVRVVGQSRHVYVFGPRDVLTGLKVSEAVELVWDKTVLGSGDLAAPWGPSHEPITFAVSKHRHGGQTGKPAVPARLRKGTVLRATRPTGRKVRHPSEKPVSLLRELVESSSRQGELVLDPFAGVGSTGVAAVLLGRRVILVETKLEYAQIAATRLRVAEHLLAQAREV